MKPIEVIEENGKMKKTPIDRTKVVIRHLPPSLSQFHLFSQFDHLFSHRYNWFSFRPGKYSLKHQRCARAYIDFKRQGDVLEFAEFFNGHIFINEKGAQFKAIVEYAPSQRVPKYCMKDSREGTIYTDPDYLEFLKLLAVPKETLPSAEAQLERKEAEQSGSAKEILTITPLMEYVRQKRSAEVGKQDTSFAGRGSKRVVNKPRSFADKQCPEKKKDILNRSTNKANRKGKSTNILAPRQEDRPATLETGKGIILLKAKGDKISPVPGGILKQPRNLPVSRKSQRFTASERSIKGILLNNGAHKNRPLAAIQPRDKTQNSNLEHDKRLAVPKNKQVGFSYLSCSEPPQPISGGNVNSNSDENFSTKNPYNSGSDSKRREKRTRNKDRPNHGVPFPISLSDIHHDNGEKLSSATLQHTGLLSDSIGGFNKNGHRVPTRRIKKHGSLVASEQRSSKGGGANGYAVHEKQVWVQKSSSGS